MRLGKLNTVKLVSLIHGGWGLAILLFYPLGVVMPRPFGSQEAFLVYMPPWVMASIMLTGAIICRLAIWKKTDHPMVAVFATVPQQIILMWSTVWGIFHLNNGDQYGNFDARGALAVIYLFALSFYHATDIAELWGRARLARLKNGSTIRPL
jgi:hypothetical protein